jgi:hypothetical protein
LSSSGGTSAVRAASKAETMPARVWSVVICRRKTGCWQRGHLWMHARGRVRCVEMEMEMDVEMGIEMGMGRSGDVGRRGAGREGRGAHVDCRAVRRCWSMQS